MQRHTACKHLESDAVWEAIATRLGHKIKGPGQDPSGGAGSYMRPGESWLAFALVPDGRRQTRPQDCGTAE